MIDCDVHANFNDIRELTPFLDPGYRAFMVNASWDGFRLPGLPWFNPHGYLRRDAYPEGGGLPGTDYELLRKQALDARDVEYAVLLAEDIHFVSSLPNADLAAALATAYNRWQSDVWLTKDKRLKGSLVVATQDAARAAAEIRSYAGHPGFVQVLFPSAASDGYGHPRYHPIYEAAIEAGFAVSIHPADEGCGIYPAPTPAGYPQYYIEWHTLLLLTAMTHVVSLVCNGVFEKYPELRFGVVEAGFLWLPSLLWRLDKNWKSLRAEVPWVKRLPSELVQEHMRFGTQPMAEPADPRRLQAAFESFPAFEHMLLYASDYPHWDGDEPHLSVRRLPAAWREAVASENARRFFRLPERETAEAAPALQPA